MVCQGKRLLAWQSFASFAVNGPMWSEFIHHSLDTVAKVDYMEIDEKAKTAVGKFQIREKLSLMNWMKCLHGLQVYNHGALD